MATRYRVVQSGERRAGTWSILDMETLTVAKVRGRPLEGLDEKTAKMAFEVLTRSEVDRLASSTKNAAEPV